MDAQRLIRSTRHALAQARSVTEVMAEAWQTCMLAETVGGYLALHGEEPLRAAAQALAEAGGHAGGCLDRPPDEWTGFGRAARLTEIAEPGAALRELRQLVHEAAEALVVVACGAETETLYWQCIDAVDAAAGCKDAVTELLRARREEADPELAEPPEPIGPPDPPATLVVPLGPPPAVSAAPREPEPIAPPP
ncbi:DUF6099 family protein [Streptomyces sp. NPDC001380]|uniref:DUF6099 family protein n=1 Tax=Streptomyces sp. NPDC001380 TaxID=3364566 RepID=UPI0036BFF056